MKNYKKYYTIPGEPELVYKALTFAPTIKLWSGQEAEMTDLPGTEFSLFDGAICGKNISFEENKMMVQEWYFGDQTEPSMVTIKLHPDKKGTSLELVHTNIPDEDFENITEGWEDIYMGGLISFYQEF